MLNPPKIVNLNPRSTGDSHVTLHATTPASGLSRGPSPVWADGGGSVQGINGHRVSLADPGDGQGTGTLL